MDCDDLILRDTGHNLIDKPGVSVICAHPVIRKFKGELSVIAPCPTKKYTPRTVMATFFSQPPPLEANSGGKFVIHSSGLKGRVVNE